MSLTYPLRRAPATAASGDDPSRRALIAWPVAPAGAVAFLISSTHVNVGRSAMTAALVVACVGLTVNRSRDKALSLGHVRLVLAGALSGSLGGLGALLSGDGSRTMLTVGSQLVLGWAAFALMLTSTSRVADKECAHDVLKRTHAMTGAAMVLVIGVASLMIGFDRRAAAALAIALPVGLTVYAVARTWERQPSDGVGQGMTAIAAGAAAAVLALMVVDHHTSGAVVGLTLLATVAVVAVVVCNSIGVTVPSWLVVVGGGVALLGAGLGPAPLALVGFGSAVALERERRPTVRSAPLDDPSRRTALRIVGVLCVVAAVLRAAASRGLWLDETTGLHEVRLPILQMLRYLYDNDNHPPLNHVILWLDIRTIGEGELALRFPAILFGVLMVPMLYVTGRELFDRRVGIIAAAIGTVAPLAVWYGQEARMYSQFMLLALITVYTQARILRNGGRRWHWVVFSLCGVALVYTQYFAVLHVAATTLVFGLEVVRRRRIGRVSPLFKNLVWSLAAQAVLIAPLVPFALHQVVRNQQRGFGFSTAGLAAGSAVVPSPGIYGLLTNIQWAIFGYLPDQLTTRLVALWPVGLLMLLLLLGRPRRAANRPLLIIAGLPVFVIFGASFIAAKSRSLAEVRYLAGAVPVLFILIAACITTVISSRRVQVLAVGTLVAAMAVALVIQETSTSNPRLYQYREAVEHVRQEAGPNDLVIYAPFFLDYVLEYYNPGVATASIGPDPTARLDKPRADAVDVAVTTHATKVFVLEGASFAESDAAGGDVATTIQRLEAQGMTITAHYQYAQISVWELA